MFNFNEKQTFYRKHFTQMTKQEINLLKFLAKGKYTMSSHSKLRIKKRKITEAQIFNTIKYGEIIEYLIVNNFSNRVMLRCEDDSIGRSIYVVVDVVSRVVVTAYKDKPYRNSTSSYEKSINIEKNISEAVNLVKGLVV